MTNNLEIDQGMDTQPKKTKRQEIENVIKNEALIEMQPSLEGMSDNINLVEGGAIYYGTGVSTPKYLSVGLPFDVLGMIMIAEKIKRKAGLKDIYHHIADTHAKTNDWADPDAIDKRAASVREVLTQVAANLKLEGFHIMLSSEFDNMPEYQELLAHFQSSDKHDYVKHEMADMEWYRTHHNVAVKAGWIIQATETNLGADERLFDREYKTFMGDRLSFLYTKPGRTFDISRPKASPYIQIPGENRLLLDPNENARAKIEESVQRTGDFELGGARKHIKSIVRLYESLFGQLDRGLELEDKVQAILNKSFGRI
jgi:hypothetical protein